MLHSRIVCNFAERKAHLAEGDLIRLHLGVEPIGFVVRQTHLFSSLECHWQTIRIFSRKSTARHSTCHDVQVYKPSFVSSANYLISSQQRMAFSTSGQAQCKSGSHQAALTCRDRGGVPSLAAACPARVRVPPPPSGGLTVPL